MRESSRAPRVVTADLVRAALCFVPADVDRETWVRIGMAIKSELGDAGSDLFMEWSSGGTAFAPADARDTWRSIKAGGRVRIGTLFHLAQRQGFHFPEKGGAQAQAQLAGDAARLTAERRARDEAEAEKYRAKADVAAATAARLWAEASDDGASPYLQRKGVCGHGVRYLRDGTLWVPMRTVVGELQNLQRVLPRRPKEGPEKRFLPGGRKVGLMHWVGEPIGAPVLLLAEGYATAASIHEATGRPVAVCFDAGNLVHVAKALPAVFPGVPLLVCGDDDRDTATRGGKNPGREKAASAARAARALQSPAATAYPEGLPNGGSDFNDLAAHAGGEAVRVQVERAALALAPTELTAGTAPENRTAPAQRIAPARRVLLGGKGEGACAADKPANGPEVAGGGHDRRGGGSDGGNDDDGPPSSDPFHVDARGVWHVPRDAEGNQKRPVFVCAPVHVTARTRADDANGWGYLLEFTDPDGNAKVWAMPSSMLSGEGAEWASRLRDMGLRMAPGTRPRNLLAQYIETREPEDRVTCTDRVGWHGSVYVLPSRSIGGADEGRRYVFQSDAGMEDTFRQYGTLAQWQERVGALCIDNSRLLFAVSCAFAGPMLRLAEVESGGIHFRGDSSQGKTTALKVAASVWGRPSYMQRWRTTDNALEATAVQHCDGLLILDEFGQLDPRVAGDVAYMLANDQEKGRGTRGGQVRKRRTWRILFLSSGEVSLAQHMEVAAKTPRAGQEVRMLDVPLDAGAGMGGLEALHGYHAPAQLADAIVGHAARHYGTPGRAWLEWATAHHAELPLRLAELLERYRDAMTPETASEQVRRAATRFALIGAAGELATEAGITGWPVGQAEHAAARCFRAWLAARGHLDNGEDAAMLRQVRSFLEKNGDALFTWMHRAMDDHRPNTPLRAGFRRMIDDEGKPAKIDAATHMLEKSSTEESRLILNSLVDYLILPEAFRRDVSKGFDATAVARLLQKRGHLVHEEGHLTKLHRLPGMGRARCYHVKPSIFVDEL